MFEEIKKINSSKKDLRNFGFIIGIIFFILGIYLFIPILIILGVFLVISGYFFPNILLPAQKVWMTLAIIISFIVTNIILTIFFYIFITPLSLISRISGKKFLENNFKQSALTYWIKKDYNMREVEDLEKQF